MELVNQIKEVAAVAEMEAEKFYNKGNKAAGTRARKALSEIGKLAKIRRQEIQEVKNNDK